MTKKLNGKQLQAIQLMVYQNMNYSQICKELDVSNNTMTAWSRKQEFIDEMDKEVKRKFKRIALKAQNKLEELIDSQSGSVSLGACKEVLSKAGYDATIKQEIVETTINVSVEDDTDG